MAIIQAVTGKYSYNNIEVDEEDLPMIEGFRWRVAKCKQTFYAQSFLIVNKRYKTILMHRLILGLGDDRTILGDHIDGNGLNNKRKNLRAVNYAQNRWNTNKKNNCSSKFLGVHAVKNRDDKWIAKIMKHGKLFHIGVFETERQAALAYNEKASELFGEFAKLNRV
jgi:hypothetical protein